MSMGKLSNVSSKSTWYGQTFVDVGAVVVVVASFDAVDVVGVVGEDWSRRRRLRIAREDTEDDAPLVEFAADVNNATTAMTTTSSTSVMTMLLRRHHHVEKLMTLFSDQPSFLSHSDRNLLGNVSLALDGGCCFVCVEITDVDFLSSKLSGFQLVYSYGGTP